MVAYAAQGWRLGGYARARPRQFPCAPRQVGARGKVAAVDWILRALDNEHPVGERRESPRWAARRSLALCWRRHPSSERTLP
eukprot:1873683-Prymnesium_polylepis.1